MPDGAALSAGAEVTARTTPPTVTPPASAPSPLLPPACPARTVRVRLGDECLAVPWTTAAESPAPPQLPGPGPWVDRADEPRVERPLIHLAWARSGDKGNIANIGVIARRPDWLPLLWAQLTPERIGRHFEHMAPSRVERFHLPGIAAINFLLHDALAGGGPASTRWDPLGKGNAQILLSMAVAVPRSLADAMATPGGTAAA